MLKSIRFEIGAALLAAAHLDRLGQFDESGRHDVVMTHIGLMAWAEAIPVPELDTWA